MTAELLERIDELEKVQQALLLVCDFLLDQFADKHGDMPVDASAIRGLLTPYIGADYLDALEHLPEGRRSDCFGVVSDRLKTLLKVCCFLVDEHLHREEGTDLGDLVDELREVAEDIGVDDF